MWKSSRPWSFDLSPFNTTAPDICFGNRSKAVVDKNTIKWFGWVKPQATPKYLINFPNKLFPASPPLDFTSPEASNLLSREQRCHLRIFFDRELLSLILLVKGSAQNQNWSWTTGTHRPCKFICCQGGSLNKNPRGRISDAALPYQELENRWKRNHVGGEGEGGGEAELF